MKLDPGIHIVMHLVLSLKPGVTEVVSELTLAVSRHIRAEVRGHEHGRVVADAKACGRARARHGRCTGTVGTGRTDVAHGTISTRRMGRGQERRSCWYLGWSGTRRGRRVLRGDDCNSPWAR